MHVHEVQIIFGAVAWHINGSTHHRANALRSSINASRTHRLVIITPSTLGTVRLMSGLCDLKWPIGCCVPVVFQFVNLKFVLGMTSSSVSDISNISVPCDVLFKPFVHLSHGVACVGRVMAHILLTTAKTAHTFLGRGHTAEYGDLYFTLEW